MPHLGKYKWILDMVVFLYESRKDAEAGADSGGTGFFVTVPTKRWPERYAHWHCVTNKHVAVSPARGPGSPVVRLNTFSGAPHIIDYDVSDWIFVSGGPDIAVSPPIQLDRTKVRVEGVDSSVLATEKDEADHDLNAAEDVFMVGRFVDYKGVEATPPAFRFGHISIMDARIEQPNRYLGRSIIVDMHSRSGFSGSPVFVYRTAGSQFLEFQGLMRASGHYLKLLGIHWGQFPEEWELRLKAKAKKKRPVVFAADEHLVEGLSGMTCVIPAADIVRALKHPDLEAMRDAIEEKQTG